MHHSHALSQLQGQGLLSVTLRTRKMRKTIAIVQILNIRQYHEITNTIIVVVIISVISKLIIIIFC